MTIGGTNQPFIVCAFRSDSLAIYAEFLVAAASAPSPARSALPWRFALGSNAWRRARIRIEPCEDGGDVQRVNECGPKERGML
jgi:hypothetical protein